MLEWWRNIPGHINPVVFSIGPLEVRWYGIMYVAAFTIIYVLVLRRIRTEPFRYSRKTIDDFMVWAILGVLAGGRLGYILFYNLKYFLTNPVEMFLPFSFSGGLHYTGIYGMSYHGGVIGVIFSSVLFCRRTNINFWDMADLFAPAVPLGYTFGRLGNFINGELYGRVTGFPWGMYFPLDSTHKLRHPSQLYEAFFEGVILFIVLWSVRKVKYFNGFQFSLYIIGYGLTRFFVEFFREPDGQIGFVAFSLTMGQVLCLFMVLAGAVIMLARFPKA
ncbi:MAG: prolipoprotein diacylglyceryl transferase [Candidatus Omnitrophica bacterium]|nr:prolipoprotein diacylglyceryl transferase [Candidatus Omnitrophota bacterium]